MCTYGPNEPAPYKVKSILAHNLLFATCIFGLRTKVIETIVTVVYKQGHLVLAFQPRLRGGGAGPADPATAGPMF